MTKTVSNQAEKAQIFADLHQPGNPLVLYNIWDAGSAKIVEEAGAKAVATGSWSVAAAQGFDDGEKLPLEIALMTAKRICETVDVPVSLDFEGAYAVGPTGVSTNVRLALKQGIVGINFEDQVIGGKGLHPQDMQVKRIAAARATADEFGVPLFINARTDLFLHESNTDWHSGLMPQALERLAAYTEAGASGFFVPGLTDPELIGRVCEAAEIPVNVFKTPAAPDHETLASLGVARISHGPNPFRQAMRDLATRYAETMG
ncbi:isocitrate lyase/PEP mutase family protein [Cognatishimia activa]|uniref:Carboxyvinyl-carboxyphosphonate phosphorylmutase n=1 Tax=Cognatishimia activa TaxID=1715691 RepID=A0A0N7MB53_9RHOB|nr:isocitrate lyase/phosphoenolpyruvate mutase family protein [Cognatishimia activa]MEE2944859.1 isocitrate lyase/phosphoenolpyruvate mutase family protein [Pseudomonadota bacterium]CUI58235.1 Carboxyvinyl-carboxyphosphonate phosphorylmutase [Cognatishimia activa]CUK24448.1 Carboxyvinyl-carboxyphosphonate phosphorylmutase [Cognatishimia activa]